MKEMTIGKTRGLQQLANPSGVFTICAVDHRRSLRKMIGNGNEAEASHQTMVDFKMDVCEVIASHASAVMLDPIYSASQAIAANVIPGDTGLLVSLEAADYDAYGTDGQFSELLIDWDVDKVRSLGASAVKIPLYYRPDLPNIASDQLNIVTKISYDCQRADIALIVSPRTYIVREIERDYWEFARKKPDLVIDTVHQVSRLPVDVLKVEFPVDVTYERDEERLLYICQQLDESSRVPWVLLSGGASFEVFCWQVKIACMAGASGFIAGRALWQEATTTHSRWERLQFLKTTGVDRLAKLTALANTFANPWHHKVQANNNYLYPSISDDELHTSNEGEEFVSEPFVNLKSFTSEANP